MLPLLGLLGAGIAGAATSGAFGLAGAGINYAQNVRLQKMQNDFNLEMWNKNNEYNSPQAQMQRFKDAGLNPNLIYSQGSAGLSSSPPVKNAPEGVDWSKSMQKLSEAFNIENLRTLVANRKKAEADADNAKTNATRNHRILNAERNFGMNWEYDYKSGKYIPRNLDEVNVIDPSAYYANRLLENNFNHSFLMPYRAALLEHQKQYLVPQTALAEYQSKMAKYQSEYYPYSFWIGTGAKAAQGLGDLVGIFNPLKWFKGFKQSPIRYNNPYSNY